MRWWTFGIPLVFAGQAFAPIGQPHSLPLTVVEGRLVGAVDHAPIAGGEVSIAFSSQNESAVGVTDSLGRFSMMVPKGWSGALHARAKGRLELIIPNFDVTTDSVHARIELRPDPPVRSSRLPGGAPLYLWIVYESPDRVDVCNTVCGDSAPRPPEYVVHIHKWNPWSEWFGDVMMEGGVAVATRLTGAPHPPYRDP